MSFRILLGAATACSWAGTLWFGSHVSSEPEIFGRWSRPYAVFVAGWLLLAVVASVAHAPVCYRRLHRIRRPLTAFTMGTVACLVIAEIATGPGEVD